MENEPCEPLSVDHSDVSSFLRPCKVLPSTSYSKSESLIPGPAGALQAALRNRDRNDSVSTQEFIQRVFDKGNETDIDFTSNPWLCAMQFFPPQETGDDAVVSSQCSTPLRSIDKHVDVGRMPQVVAVIKSCTPNGFGDMMVTLKDPTASVAASIHRKVFTEGQFGTDIAVGSVVVLHEVAVFSPFRRACYLNITLRNILNVFFEGLWTTMTATLSVHVDLLSS